MKPKPPRKLLSPKAFVKIRQWNVRIMFEMAKCAQVIKEMQAQKRETPAHLEKHEDDRAKGETPYMAGG